MKKKSQLQIKRETLHAMASPALAAVVGGVAGPVDNSVSYSNRTNICFPETLSSKVACLRLR